MNRVINMDLKYLKNKNKRNQEKKRYERIKKI